MKQVALATPQERGDVFRIAAEKARMDPSLMEKDFWVCWTLERLFGLPEIAPHLVFKGGTTLSKVYGVIRRFSEDVDISISRDFIRPDAPDAAEDEALSKTRRRKEIETLVAAFHQAVAEVILPRLQDAITTELGAGAERVTVDSSDPGTLNFTYPEAVGAVLPYIRPVVKIEMGGRSDVWPTETATIIPYAAEILPQAFERVRFRFRAIYWVHCCMTQWGLKSMGYVDSRAARKAKIASALSLVQCIPAWSNRCVTTCLQVASTTPEPM